MRFSDLSGHHVAIWGFGREGQAAFRRCRDLGITPVVAEPDLTEPPVYEALWGEEGVHALLESEVVIKSPGVPVTGSLYQQLKLQGTMLTSVTDLWLNENADRTIGVTGTKGKSTTSALIDHLLRGMGASSALLGNIGNPVLDEPQPPAEIVVLEVSSYQSQSLTISPRWAVVTSLFPEHLTWHGSEEAYYNDKLHLVDGGPEWVLSAPDPDLLARLEQRLPATTELLTLNSSEIHVEDGDVVWPGGRRIPAEALPLVGSHNAANIALALSAVCRLLSLDPGAAAGDLTTALASFRPLAHRLETVPSDDRRRWVDDGLATAPAAVVASLQALGGTDICVIVGGADRGLDFAPLIDYWRNANGIEVVLIGAAGRRIADQLEHEPISGWHLEESFAAAARWAHSDRNPATTVLLSPGAPSQDEYRDYVDRAEAFRRIALGGES
ncbi:MAG TPA: UDP-N-acetylmuramoyl-L-alanine--D-glutamate ligase [Marmoricola sp.]|nr:UDP-N-acetylmuramoyl-L-alanine--D-glutamate ligase [Marmoricola sp.]